MSTRVPEWLDGPPSRAAIRLDDECSAERAHDGLGSVEREVDQISRGIAHDFNNLLAVILSCSQFLMEDLDADDPRREDAEEIKRAAERGVDLVRQLPLNATVLATRLKEVLAA